MIHSRALTAYLVPSNCTIPQITDIVVSIKAPIVSAVPELETLVGVKVSVVLAPVGAAVRSAELTVSQPLLAATLGWKLPHGRQSPGRRHCC